jgi:XTP/dITP diphosphohydrolase
MKLLLATGNEHKARELGALLGSTRLELTTLKEFPAVPPVVEDGRTLMENAVKKALEPALATGLWALADDTGLEVEALGGRPGVFSARYAGPDCDFKANCEKLLGELEGVPPLERRAVFRTVVALASPQGRVQCREGRLEGRIASHPVGKNGFGYDPVFFIPDEGRTLAQLDDDEKNALSHRALALKAILPVLEDLAK